MRLRSIFVLGVIACCTALPAWADRPWLVGEYGDFSRIEFHGNETFPADELVRALDGDFALLAPSRPLASLATLLRTIESELLHGYRQQGFPWAAITVQFDETKQLIVADIVEGQRCTNGPIVVDGVTNDLAMLLTEALSQDAVPQSTGSYPEGFASAEALKAAMEQQHQRQALWKDATPTSFTEFTQNQLRQRASETLQQAGYLDADADIELVPDVETGTTTLQIHASAGPATTIEAVEIVGVARHTPAEIQEFLGMAVGQPCDLFQRRVWEQQLEASGRFAAYTISTESLNDQPGAQRVRIDLNECEEVPTLGEELSDVDLALLRTCDWLAHPDNYGGNISLHARGGLEALCGYFGEADDNAEAADTSTTDLSLPGWLQGSILDLQLMLSPHGQSRCEISIDDASGSRLFGYGFSFSSTGTEIWSNATRNSLSFEHEGGPLPNANVTFIRVPTTPEGHKFSMMFGMGVSSNAGGVLQIRMTPAYVLTHAHSEGANFEIRDGVLYAEWESVTAQFEVATGRLICCECRFEDGISAIIQIDDRAIAGGEINRELDATYTQLNRGQPGAIAFGEFLAAEAGWWASRLGYEDEQARWEAVSRLLRNLDEPSEVETVSFTSSDADDDATFFIPASETLATNPLRWVGQFVLWGNTAVMSRGAPAWQVGREAVALLMGDVTAFVELERLSRDEQSGPLTSLYAAELLRYLHPGLEQMWAERGRARLDADSLQHDFDALITEETAVGRLLIELAAQAGRLPENELRAVLAGIGDEWFDAAITVMTDRNQTPEGRLQQLMQILWAAGLKDTVEHRLRSHLPWETATTTP